MFTYLYWMIKCAAASQQNLLFNADNMEIRQIGEAMIMDGAPVDQVNQVMFETWWEKIKNKPPFLYRWMPVVK